MKKTFLLLGVIALAVSGCVTPSRPLFNTFKPAECEFILTNGTARITGQAFLKTRSGDVKYAAGDTVILRPRTDYSVEIYQRSMNEGTGTFNYDYSIHKYERTTVADGMGNFEFVDVPAGNYFIICTINWEYPTEYGLSTTGGTIFYKVDIKEGSSNKYVVTIQ